ncbi:MAG TPA: hypothetical protein DD670_02200, partial [Planctomycetaceae bacterium]|nr:hypothetical protein [Planctomycetaceae bacterium]
MRLEGMGGGMTMGGQFGEQEKTWYEVTIDLRGIIYIYLPSPLEEGREEVERAEEITPTAPAVPAVPAAAPTVPAVPPTSDVAPTPTEPAPAPITP